MLPHAVSILFAGFVIYVVKPGSDSFTWHPILMTLAFTFMTAEAIMTMSPKNSIMGNMDRKTRILVHRALATLATLSALAGFYAVYITKEKFKKPHLATPHAIAGCITVCYLIMQNIAGTNLIYPQLITKFLRIDTMRKLHRMSGGCLFLISMLALLGGLNTDYFKKVVHPPQWYACLAAPLLLSFFILKQAWFRKVDVKKM